MPGGDRTGPAGMGPMTGRAAGYCAGYPVPGYMNPAGPGGFRRCGRGWRNRFYATGLKGWQRAMGLPAFGGTPPAPMSAEQQLDALKGQAEYFEDTLNGIRNRIEELKAAAGKD